MGDEIPCQIGAQSQLRCETSLRTRSRHFVKGPIPMPWLEKAASLPGKALAVGVLLWFQHGITKQWSVSLKPGLLKRFRVGRKAMYRGVDALEAAGLIKAQRYRGKSPVVTIMIPAQVRD